MKNPLIFSLCLALALQAATDTAPLNFPPSLHWDGDDGSWSSFAVQIGTPPQEVRLLPSITGSSIWAVLYSSCNVSISSNCAASHGDLFSPSNSSTWDQLGLYDLPLNPEHYLPYSGGAYFGFDNVTLDSPGDGGNMLPHQIIAAFRSDNIYLGSIGLSPTSINVTSLDDAYPSFLGTLNQRNEIPSSSWAYLAGASYYSFPTLSFGSLIFGGYDGRFRGKDNLTLAGGSDEYRPFLLSVESITSGSAVLQSVPIVVALDSLTSQIWLPIQTCRAFESAFGLVWNETYELYILSVDQHSALIERNASIVFELSSGLAGSDDRLNITLPYAAFDLQTSPPFAGPEPQYYFPLKRAANDTQYTLGRTFLQEVYMISDFDRGEITLHQAVYPDSSVEADIVSICHPNATECNGIRSETSQLHPGLKAGAIVGIVIGAIAGLVLLVVITIFVRRRKTSRKRKTYPPASNAKGKGPAPANNSRSELWDTQRKELDGSGAAMRHELESSSEENPTNGKTNTAVSTWRPQSLWSWTRSRSTQSRRSPISPISPEQEKSSGTDDFPGPGGSYKQVNEDPSLSELEGGPTIYELPT